MSWNVRCRISCVLTAVDPHFHLSLRNGDASENSLLPTWYFRAFLNICLFPWPYYHVPSLAVFVMFVVTATDCFGLQVARSVASYVPNVMCLCVDVLKPRCPVGHLACVRVCETVHFEDNRRSKSSRDTLKFGEAQLPKLSPKHRDSRSGIHITHFPHHLCCKDTLPFCGSPPWSPRGFVRTFKPNSQLLDPGSRY
jgi:hypothetical protein